MERVLVTAIMIHMVKTTTTTAMVDEDDDYNVHGG